MQKFLLGLGPVLVSLTGLVAEPLVKLLPRIGPGPGPGGGPVDVEEQRQRKGACFAAGTPMRTPEGSKRIELIRAGDYVLSRSEYDVLGQVEARQVEEVFQHTAQIWTLRLGGQEIRTTSEHPFFVRGKGWVAASELTVDDIIASEDGAWIPVEGVEDTGTEEVVFNFRVAEFATYFVGCQEWGFSVWSHNTCWYHGTHSGETVSTLGLNKAAFLANDPEEPDKGFFVTQNEAFARTAAAAKTSWVNFRDKTTHTPVLLVADDAVIWPFLRSPAVALEGGEEGEMYIPVELFDQVPRNAFRRTP